MQNFFLKKILVSGILAAIDTFSEHVIIGVSWVVDRLFVPFSMRQKSWGDNKNQYFTVADLLLCGVCTVFSGFRY